MGFNLYRHWILFLSIATFVRINISTKSRLPNCPATYAYITLRASQFHPHTTAAIRKVWDRAGHWKIGIGIGVASPRWSLLMRGKRSAEWCWSCAGWITQPSGMIAVYYLIADAEVYQKESECQKNLFTASSASPEARVFLRRFYAFLGCFFSSAFCNSHDHFQLSEALITSLCTPSAICVGTWCQAQFIFPTILTLCFPLIGFPEVVLTTMHSHQSTFQIPVLRKTLISSTCKK